MLADYQRSFIHFLIEAKALLFGNFKLKSGREAPYFVNTGLFNNGPLISKLGTYYAEHIMKLYEPLPDVVFGPAYKGIPLSVSTSIALTRDWNASIGYTFDRKEEKGHGDGGLLVGAPIKDGSRIVLVEDVVTAGTTLNKIIPFLRQYAKVDIVGVVVAVDRCERGGTEKSAVREASDSLGIRITPLITIFDILSELSGENASGFTLSDAQQDAIKGYLEQYGGER